MLISRFYDDSRAFRAYPYHIRPHEGIFFLFFFLKFNALRLGLSRASFRVVTCFVWGGRELRFEGHVLRLEGHVLRSGGYYRWLNWVLEKKKRAAANYNTIRGRIANKNVFGFCDPFCLVIHFAGEGLTSSGDSTSFEKSHYLRYERHHFIALTAHLLTFSPAYNGIKFVVVC